MALGKAKVPERMLTLLHSVKQALWQLRHGTRLSADKGTDLNSELVGFLNRHSGKDGRGKGACEAVAGTYRVVHFHLGCRLEALHAGRKDVAAVGATGEHEHLQVVLAEDEIRSEERRVGKECRSRWSPYH